MGSDSELLDIVCLKVRHWEHCKVGLLSLHNTYCSFDIFQGGEESLSSDRIEESIRLGLRKQRR